MLCELCCSEIQHSNAPDLKSKDGDCEIENKRTIYYTQL